MQTSINKAGQPVAFAGLVSDNGPKDIVSRFNAGSAEIPFGCACKVGAARNGVVLPSSDADVIDGFSVWGFNHMIGANGDLDAPSGGLRQNAGLQVIRKGRIYLVVDSTVVSITPNVDRAYVRGVSHAGVGTIVGAVTNAADSGYTIDYRRNLLFVSGLFLSADGVTNIAEVEVDLTISPTS